MCFDKGSSLCTMGLSPAVALQQEVRDGNEYWHVFTQPCIDAASKDSENELVSKVRKPYTMSKQRERWSEDEHMKFLEALKLYGRAWRRIEEHIGSKTAVQIRSHAQKFFSKLEREQSTPGTLPRRPQDIEIPPPRPKRKPNHPYPRKAGGAPSSPTVDIRTGGKADTTSSASLFEKPTNLAAGVDPASRVGFAPYNPHLVVQSKLDFIEPSKSMTLFGQTFFLDKTASERKRAQNILQMADRDQTTAPMCVVEDSSKSESSNLSEAHADQTSPAPLVSNIEREVENLGRQATQDIQSCEKQQAPLGTMNENSMEQSHQAPVLTAKDTELLHEATFKSQFLNSLATGGHCGGMSPHTICPGLYGPGIWQPMSSLSPAHLSSAMENMWPGLNSAEVMVSEETRAAAAAAATFAAASAWWTLVGAAHHNALSMTEPAYGGQMVPPNNLETTAMQPHRPVAVIIDKGNSEAVRADQACSEMRTSDKVGDVLGSSQVEQSSKCNQQSGGDSCSSESCDPVIKITKCMESTKKVRGHERATAKLKKSRVISKNTDTTKETIGTRTSHKQTCTLVGGNSDENLSGDGGPSSNWSACSKGNRSKPLPCVEVENSQCPMSTESELKQSVEVDLARIKGADSSEHLAASLIEAQSTLSNDFSIQKGSDLNSRTGHNKISTASRSEISDVETMESTLTKKQLRRLEGSCSSNSVNTLQMQEDQEEGSTFRAVAAQECNVCLPASPSKPVGVTFCGLAFVPYKRKRVNSLQTDSGKISDGDRESDPCRQEKRNRPADRVRLL